MRIAIFTVAALASTAAFADDKCAEYSLSVLNKLKVDRSGLAAYEVCEIGVTQDAKGNIEALTLRKCPPAIRYRVAQDIIKSAPLPLSPDPSCIKGEQTYSFRN